MDTRIKIINILDDHFKPYEEDKNKHRTIVLKSEKIETTLGLRLLNAGVETIKSSNHEGKNQFLIEY